MPDSTIINPVTIENLRALSPGDNDEFLREIVDIFIVDTPERIAEMENSLAAGDMKTFARAAHSIKGSAANVGAQDLQAIAQVLESHGHAGEFSLLPSCIAQARQEFERARIELRRLAGSIS